MPPVDRLASSRPTTFSDKEQIWADNASVEPVLRHRLRLLGVLPRPGEGQRRAGAADRRASRTTAATPGRSSRSRPAANNGQRNPTDGCTVRTDSHGTAYVFGVGTVSSLGHDAFELMSTSTDGGQSWSQAPPVAGPVTQPGHVRPRPRPAGDRRRRRRAQRPRPGAERRHRQRRADGRGRDEPDRDDLRQRRRSRRRTSTSPSRRTAAARWSAPRAIETDGRPRLSTPRRRSRRTAPTSTSSTTRSRRRSSRRRPTRGRSSASSCTPTSAATGADRRVHASSTAARPATRAARARTTSRASSSATTSTRWRRGRTARRSGTTPATRPTARRSTPGGRRSRTGSPRPRPRPAAVPADVRQLRHLGVHDGAVDHSHQGWSLRHPLDRTPDLPPSRRPLDERPSGSDVTGFRLNAGPPRKPARRRRFGGTRVRVRGGS